MLLCEELYYNCVIKYVTPPLVIFSSSDHPPSGHPCILLLTSGDMHTETIPRKNPERLLVKICEKCAIVVISLRRKKLLRV